MHLDKGGLAALVHCRDGHRAAPVCPAFTPDGFGSSSQAVDAHFAEDQWRMVKDFSASTRQSPDPMQSGAQAGQMVLTTRGRCRESQARATIPKPLLIKVVGAAVMQIVPAVQRPIIQFNAWVNWAPKGCGSTSVS